MVNTTKPELSASAQFNRSVTLILVAIAISVLAQNIYSFSDELSATKYLAFLFIGGYIGVFWRQIYSIADRLPFAVVCSGGIVAGTAIGTFFPQFVSVDQFMYADSFFSKLLLFFQLNDVFHSWWYVALYVLLVVSLVLVALRYPFSLRYAGFHLVHLSLVVIIGSVWVDFFFGMKGIMHLEEGKSSSTIYLYYKNTSVLAGQIDIPYSVRLDAFSSKKHDPDYRIQLWKKNVSVDAGRDTVLKASPEPIASFKIDTAKREHLFDKAYSFAVQQFYPDAQFERVQRNNYDSSVVDPVLFGSIKTNGIQKRFRMNRQRKKIKSPFGNASLWFVWDKDMADSIGNANNHVVARNIVTLGRTPYVLTEGSVLVDDGGLLVVADHFSEEPVGNGQARHAIHLQCTTKDSVFTCSLVAGEQEHADVLSKELEKRLGKKLSFLPNDDACYIVVGSEGMLYSSVKGHMRKDSLMFGHTYYFAGWRTIGFEFDQLFNNQNDVETIVVSASDSLNNPMAKVSVLYNSDTVSQALLPRFDGTYNSVLDIPGTNFFLTLESLKSKETEYWKSDVSFLGPNGDMVDDAEIMVNHPKTFRGYRFYQTDFDPLRPSYSGVGVTYEPALYVMYAAFYAFIAGIILVFYFPAKRKE